jgi:uncharacterized protein YbcV (DUF1398 family)
MSKAVENLVQAQQFAMSIRPKVGGFPYLAEVLRKAGIEHNIWNLPSCQSIYITQHGSVVSQGTPLVNTMTDIPKFNREALITALRTDQDGKSSFPEFLKSAWEAGVVSYTVDFNQRIVTYYGISGESYAEHYPAVDIDKVRKL